jgi:PAS domain-containing protein
MLHPRLQNRINNLFSSLNEYPTKNPIPDSKKIYGWVWECDAQGNYIFCSPEVKEALGFCSDNFIGQPLTRFALQNSSAELLKRALNSKRHPLEIDLEYKTLQRKSRMVKLYVMRTPATNGHHPRWRGFAQLLDGKSGQEK